MKILKYHISYYNTESVIQEEGYLCDAVMWHDCKKQYHLVRSFGGDWIDIVTVSIIKQNKQDSSDQTFSFKSWLFELIHPLIAM